MKIFWSKVLVLACLVTTSFALYAQNKTVVIPLGSDEAPTSYWAVVGSDGTLVRGSSGTTSTQLFKPGIDGSYEVDFGDDVSNCALVATLGRTDDANLDPPAGEIGTAYRNGKLTAVYVKTRNSAGTAEDRSFHLTVLC